MRVYPSYESRVTVDWSSKRLRVDVWAGTDCGPKVEGSHAMRLLTTSDEEVESATKTATTNAAVQMRTEYRKVTQACRKNHHH